MARKKKLNLYTGSTGDLFTLSDLHREAGLAEDIHLNTLANRIESGRYRVPPYDWAHCRSNGRPQGFWNGRSFAAALKALAKE